MLKLTHLRVSRFETDNPPRGPGTAYGLQPPASGNQIESGRLEPIRCLWLQFGKSPTNDASHVYARCNGQSTIVRVPLEPISAWQTGFQEFRDSHLVRLRDGLPDVIEVSGSQENFAVERQTNDAWRITKPIELPADTNAMRAFIGDLTGLQVVRNNTQVAVDDAVPPDSEFPRLRSRINPLDNTSLRAIPNARFPDIRTSNAVIAELDFGLRQGTAKFMRAGRIGPG